MSNYNNSLGHVAGVAPMQIPVVANGGKRDLFYLNVETSNNSNQTMAVRPTQPPTSDKATTRKVVATL